MLAIARALVANPRLLLLDEPCEGLAPIIIEQLVVALKQVRSEGGLAVVMVEQLVDTVLEYCDRVMVLDRGQVSWSGPSRALASERSRLDALIGIGES
jgi:branched-chain amino acid transport system ATP-binding protein